MYQKGIIQRCPCLQGQLQHNYYIFQQGQLRSKDWDLTMSKDKAQEPKKKKEIGNAAAPAAIAEEWSVNNRPCSNDLGHLN